LRLIIKIVEEMDKIKKLKEEVFRVEQKSRPFL